ncbi:alpha-1,6-mannosyl-glycoprotein 2-beta-N-acetylglucosaminyltransferase isoform X3 [Nilaparvata lugens]|uniref:alpha-1,6-mannosyl-glycoprotein 2-beta-N-acetylglucosaminyltransferase isoform X3 n=1 Tax=Nilaparvata lugens TaxID=108931 RepID=UPI00193E8444|nr:alpha-1,6-mannosyl-glycoprotein 2-beta-N-acetylglucosaminyltransferase isoform X3 [Nilaparvata lugens]
MRRYQIASRVPESNSRFIAVCCCAEMRGGRRRTASCLRTAVFLFVVTFVWLQLHLTNLGGGGGQGGTLKDTTNDNDSSAAILSMVPQVLHKFLTSKPRNTTHSLNGSNMSVDAHRLTIDEIRHNIEKYNQMQTVHNEDLFGPLLNDSLIIVIQVHTRLIYLRHLIVSLAQAQEIDSTLLVFSHDYYNEEINEVVQSIDFAKVMQIFYPYSIQTHPNTFPGESPDDCPRDINYEQAVLRKCTNALHPDLYGHYREAKFTQTKHHWWWKANRVFNQLEVTRYHTGMVLFVEEDHYVAEDFIHILKLMEKTSKASCPACNILSLGTYLKTYDYYSESKKAEVTPWISSKHNMGMALNRSTWQELRKCGRLLCTYDDYNWDWSLQHVSQACLPHKLTAVVMRVPRIFHIGECGVHHKKANCQSTGVISKVQKVLANAAHHLYPSHLTLTFTTGAKKHKLRKGNGGWGDVRDHELCMNMTQVDR